jgi:hypothetical protein
MYGLGPLHAVSLRDARERARKARLQLLDGLDPVSAKHEARKAEKEAAAKFRAAAELYHAGRDEVAESTVQRAVSDLDGGPCVPGARTRRSSRNRHATCS